VFRNHGHLKLAFLLRRSAMKVRRARICAYRSTLQREHLEILPAMAAVVHLPCCLAGLLKLYE